VPAQEALMEYNNIAKRQMLACSSASGEREREREKMHASFVPHTSMDPTKWSEPRSIATKSFAVAAGAAAVPTKILKLLPPFSLSLSLSLSLTVCLSVCFSLCISVCLSLCL